MANKPRINYALAATLLAAGHSLAEIAPQVGAKNAGSLSVGLHRRGVTRAKAISAVRDNFAPELTKSLTLTVARQATDALREKSERARSTLADVIEQQTQTLAKQKVPKAMPLQNLHADTVGKVVKAASTVFGWEEDRPAALVIAGDMRAFDGLERESIEVASTVQPPDPTDKS